MSEYKTRFQQNIQQNIFWTFPVEHPVCINNVWRIALKYAFFKGPESVHKDIYFLHSESVSEEQHFSKDLIQHHHWKLGLGSYTSARPFTLGIQRTIWDHIGQMGQMFIWVIWSYGIIMGKKIGWKSFYVENLRILDVNLHSPVSRLTGKQQRWIHELNECFSER